MIHKALNFLFLFSRYFFKTICEELDSSVIQEEVVGDMDLLPFIDGKVKGVVKPAE